jgi:ATP-binding cassette subfamily B protein
MNECTARSLSTETDADPGSLPPTAVECLVIAAARVGADLPRQRVVDACQGDEGAGAISLLLRAARRCGLQAHHVEVSWHDLALLEGVHPTLAPLANGNWVVCLGVEAEGGRPPAVRVLDPLAHQPQPLLVTEEQFRRCWRGDLVLLKKAPVAGETQSFGLRWFLREMAHERRLFREVAIAALMLNALGLATPIFFQLIVDKVLVHRTYSTLYALGVGMGVALLFDALFTFLRRYVLLFAVNRIDIRVATRTFKQLLSLPVSFFEQIPAGILVKHMQQAGKIREFLTGRLFLTLLEAAFLLLYVPVLALYSERLTLLVLGFALSIGLVVLALVGPFQRRLRDLYEAEGERQALLVETVQGMRTVKSLAMEPQQRQAWNQRSAQAVSTRFRLEQVSALAQASTGLLEKMMTVAIIVFGALAVFRGELSVGALVAFSMLASRVSGPLTQIVTMAHDYQDAALSVRMLGEVMKRQPERQSGVRGLCPQLQGRIEFEGVSFRYGPDGPPVLQDVSFTVPEGQVFGIVGRSGSGKTTLMRLIQGLSIAQQGVLRMDGVDIREIDLEHLRRRIGVVLQDSFLFRGSVRDNIGRAKPGASFEDVVAAAQLAGAAEFIERLPRGFDTQLEEGGVNLSGGQRQRLAIARALILQPPLLLLDEATSALDPESELIIRRNLRRIAEGRTTIIISHRLSTLADAHQILVLDRGAVVDIGSHRQLLSRCSTYLQLWQQQASAAA